MTALERLNVLYIQNQWPAHTISETFGGIADDPNLPSIIESFDGVLGMLHQRRERNHWFEFFRRSVQAAGTEPERVEALAGALSSARLDIATPDFDVNQLRHVGLLFELGRGDGMDPAVRLVRNQAAARTAFGGQSFCESVDCFIALLNGSRQPERLEMADSIMRYVEDRAEKPERLQRFNQWVRPDRTRPPMREQVRHWFADGNDHSHIVLDASLLPVPTAALSGVRSAQTHFTQDFFEFIRDYPGTNTMVRNYVAGVEKGTLEHGREKREALLAILLHAVMDAYDESDSVARNDEIAKVWQKYTVNDSIPFALTVNSQDNPEAVEAEQQIQRVMTRGFRLYHGFSGLSFDCRRAPDEWSWPLAAFGSDVGVAHYINASNPIAFPGRGVRIESIRTEDLFMKDPAFPHETFDPYHMYKEAWPFASNMADLGEAVFLCTPGMMCVFVRNDDHYDLRMGPAGEPMPACYVVFNDHFENHHGYSMFLAPTALIAGAFAGSYIPADVYTGFDPAFTDMNTRPVHPKLLLEAAEEQGLSILNLGGGSNLGGGLVNAYPLDSAPYFTWEPERRPRETVDAFGRVHKSHMLGGYLSVMTPELLEAYRPLQEAGQMIYDVATRYQNLMDLFFVGLSRWRKGLTVGGGKPGEQEATDFAEGSWDDSRFNRKSARMLYEAHKWHQGVLRGKLKRENAPVLCIVWSRDPSTFPEQEVYIDTYDWTINYIADGRKVPLPDDPDDAVYPFLKQMYGRAQDDRLDIRLMDRRDLEIA